MRFLRRRRVSQAVRSASELLEIQNQLAGRSSRDAVRDISTRDAVLRELVANAEGLPSGNERGAMLQAAEGLYDADPSITCTLVNRQVAQALERERVADWFAVQIPPESTDPPSLNDAEVRELLAESFADVIVADLSRGERRAIALGRATVGARRIDRWIDVLVEDVWHGETLPTMPSQVRSALRSELLSQIGSA